MEMPEPISPEVALSQAEMDDKRIQERSNAGYFRPFWDAYKGHVRGMLVGIAIGGLLATGIGLAVASIAGLGITTGAFWGMVALFASSGALMGSEAYGDVGAASASRAAGLAEKHARLLDPAYKNAPLAAIDDSLMAGGNGHHYEFPASRDKHKWFSWKSGLIGTVVGAVTGGALAHAAAVAGTALPSILVPVVAAFGAINPVVVGAVCLGLFGLSFGVDRSIFKSVFNLTDANNRGEILPHTGPDLGKAQSLGKENDQQLEMHRLQRQEDMHSLTKTYNNKIFWGSLTGAFRGTAGGLVIGTLLGLSLGTIAALVFPAVASSAALITAFTGAGALFGMNTFASIGREAGAESTARAIDTEFEHNRALRAKGITPPPPHKSEGRWFSLSTALIMGTIGAVIGIPLVFALGLQGGVIASALTMGLAGATYGIGSKPLHMINDKVTKLYELSYLGKPAENISLSAPYVPPPVYEDPITPAELAKLRTHEQQRNTEKSFVQSVTNQPSLSVGIS